MFTLSKSCILLTVLGGILLLTAFEGSPLAGLLDRPVDSPVDEDVFDRTFPVRAGERLNVEVHHSDVIVSQAGGTEARVRIALEGRNAERARQFYEHLNFEVTHDGGTLSVRTNPRSNWNGSTGGADIRVYVDVPEVFDADVDVAHGDVEIAGLKGQLALRVAHGDLSLGTLGGAVLSVDVAHGDIDAEALASEKVRINVQHGDVAVGSVRATEVDISAVHGDVDIDELDAFARLSAQHGDISARLAAFRGGEFRTQHGDVSLSAPADTGADVEIEASAVDIASAFQFAGTQRDGHLNGRVNGGGERLSVRSSHGDVALRAR